MQIASVTFKHKTCYRDLIHQVHFMSYKNITQSICYITQQDYNQQLMMGCEHVRYGMYSVLSHLGI